MAIYMTKGSTTITLKDPTWPEGPEYIPRQVVGESGGGAIKVAVVGDPDVIHKLNFRHITAAQHSALLTFLQSTITFSAFTFKYQDWTGVTISNNMRYMSGIDSWKRSRGNKYAGHLLIKRDLGVAP